MDKVKIFVLVICLLIVGTVATAVLRGDTAPSGPGKYDQFTKCLKDQGATFYGAFWCPHCQSQKKMFGSSQKLLPYVECSTADGNGQTAICIENGIDSYPTWVFQDGTKQTGEVPLEFLAEKTSCVLPDGSTPSASVDTGASSPVEATE